ncbi:MAG: enolase C-terminal domain-like protein [Chloroflexota bacterium]
MRQISEHPGLTIRQIRCRAFDLPLSRAIETAAGAMLTVPLVLIDLLTEEGITGRAYVRCYTPLALQPLAQLITNLDEILRGHVAAPASVEQKLQRHFRLLGLQGLTGIAMAGIDMALWDARAKASGLPLVTLLGGEPKPIPAYASLHTMNPEGAAAEAEEVLALGFTAIKVKVGQGQVAADLAVIRAIRRAVGDGIKLMVDYNQSLSVAEAIERVRVLDEEGLYWIEEPTRADDYGGHARIRAAARTAIQLGENWWGPHDMVKSVATGASDHVMLDVMKLGGVTGWLRAAAIAEGHGLPASSHTFPEFSVHLLGVTPTCRWLEYLDHVGPILKEPVRVVNGQVLTPTTPGSGIEWDEHALQRTAKT